MSKLSRDQFVERVILHVREKFPLVKIARSSEPFSLKINGHSVAMENLYRLVALKPDELDHHTDRWIVELLRAAEGLPDQSASFEELKDRILPMVLNEATRDAKGFPMIKQPLIDKLAVGYAVDNDRTISYIPLHIFKTWNIDIDQLHEIALKNLTERSDALQAQASQDENGRVNLILFQTLDGYDASRVLLPTLHNKLREHLGSPFAAAIPNRDILLCFRDDEETVGRLKKQIAEDYKTMPHQITDKLLLVTQDGIAVRQPRAGE